jgi:hypothetical protein
MIVVHEVNDDITLLVRQPYLEGMFPHEYSVILHSLPRGTPVSFYLEAQPVVSDSQLINTTHITNHYFSRRFHKYTQIGYEDAPDYIP